MNELVSVVIPTYNREKTIIRAINSVLNQTYENIEVIVVDDCSTDNTSETITKYVQDKRVRYHKLNKNSGACVARNEGVKLSLGKFIAFQDSDDIWLPNKLDEQMDFLINGGFDFVTCGFIRKSNNKITKLGYREIGKDPEEIWCKLINGNWVSTQTILCYKSCFDQISFDSNVKRFQDWDLALQASLNFKIGSLDKCLVEVEIQNDSITKQVKAQNSLISILDKHTKDAKNNIMRAQLFKSYGDVYRDDNILKSCEYYIKSMSQKSSMKTFLLFILTLTGIIRVYDRKFMGL